MHARAARGPAPVAFATLEWAVVNDFPIAVIPGDGVGREVIPEGIRALDAVAAAAGSFRLQYEWFDWSTERYQRRGAYMPDDWQQILDGFPAIYFGAAGWPAAVPDHISLWQLILPIRKVFDQFANVRPIRLLPGLAGRLIGKRPEHINFVCVRENTEGEYAGVGGRVHRDTPHEVAIQTIVFTRHAVERVVRYAFDLAVVQGRRKVTSVTKSNAMQYNMVFWDEVFDAVAAEYPHIATERVLVDAMAARFVTHPETLDVVVASNLFADILTDLGGALQGSLGMPPSANIDPTRRHPSLFEPVHGSAPDIAGKGIANPLATIWAGQMLLEFLGETEAAALLMRAVEAVTADGRVLTPDLGGTATTEQVGSAVAEAVKSLAN